MNCVECTKCLCEEGGCVCVPECHPKQECDDRRLTESDFFDGSYTGANQLPC